MELSENKFCILFICLVSLWTGSIGQEIIECIDNMEDFETFNWEQTTAGLLEYAETGDDLPETLMGLNGNGIFYFKSLESNRFGQGLVRNTTDLTDSQPYLFYIRYYTHGQSEDRQTVIFPSTDSLYTYLPQTSNFEWGEALAPVDPFKWDSDILGSWVYQFEAGEFFLIDKIILAHGYRSLSIAEMKDMCSFDDPPTTTTTTTTTEVTTTEEDPATTTEEDPETTTEEDPATTTEEDPETTTEEDPATTTEEDPATTTEEDTTTTSTTTTTTPAPSFPCDNPGYFPDPFNCTVYHHCQINAVGDLWDTILLCEDETVWCQEVKKCESEDICPCTIQN